MYPSSLIGRVVSQEDVPVSRFRSFCFLSYELISFLIISRIFFCQSFFIDFIYFFLLFSSGSGSCLLNWSVMRLQRCSDIMMEFWCRGYKNNSFLSFSVIVIPPVMTGINSVRITSSTFLNRLLVPGIVLI